jgi:hypothetical protein
VGAADRVPLKVGRPVALDLQADLELEKECWAVVDRFPDAALTPTAARRDARIMLESILKESTLITDRRMSVCLKRKERRELN